MPLTVGLFTESYDPVVNGASTSVKTLAAELVRAHHSPVIVAPRFPGFDDLVHQNVMSEFRVLRLPSWQTPWNPQNPFAYPPLPSWLAPPPRALRNVRFDIVHTQHPFGMGRQGKQMARRLRVPLVSTFHTLYTEYVHYFPVVPPASAKWWINRTLAAYYNGCEAVIVPSFEAGRRLQTIGVRENLLHVVPTGVEEAVSVAPLEIAHARRTYTIGANVPVVLFVGRLSREKNLPLLFEAFARVLNGGGFEVPPVLLLVGSGPWKDACEVLAQKTGVLEQVRFAGFVSRANLAPLYAMASVFAFPSPTETQGVVLSEAQSYGLACVVVEGGGASEFVRNDVDALVVPPQIGPFADAIADLLHNAPKRFAFSRAAYESGLRPTPAGMANSIMAIYEHVLASF